MLNVIKLNFYGIHQYHHMLYVMVYMIMYLVLIIYILLQIHHQMHQYTQHYIYIGVLKHKNGSYLLNKSIHRLYGIMI